MGPKAFFPLLLLFFFLKTGAYISDPHLWAGVSPRNGKANFREPEAGMVGWTWAGEVLGYGSTEA